MTTTALIIYLIGYVAAYFTIKNILRPKESKVTWSVIVGTASISIGSWFAVYIFGLIWLIDKIADKFRGITPPKWL